MLSILKDFLWDRSIGRQFLRAAFVGGAFVLQQKGYGEFAPLLGALGGAVAVGEKNPVEQPEVPKE